MNHNIAAFYGEPSIQKVVKVGKIEWAGHVPRVPDNIAVSVRHRSGWYKKAKRSPGKIGGTGCK